jgi:hypothetical protein
LVGTVIALVGRKEGRKEGRRERGKEDKAAEAAERE